MVGRPSQHAELVDEALTAAVETWGGSPRHRRQTWLGGKTPITKGEKAAMAAMLRTFVQEMPDDMTIAELRDELQTAVMSG